MSVDFPDHLAIFTFHHVVQNCHRCGFGSYSQLRNSPVREEK
jgi:ribosomal protein L37E